MLKKSLFCLLIITGTLGVPAFSDDANTTVYDLGNAKFIALNNNPMQVGKDLVKYADANKLFEYMSVPGWNNGGMNYYILNTGKHKILFDAGLSPAQGGQIVERLAEVGLKPSDIDIICVTHMHGDHIGGLLDERGNAMFTNVSKIFIAKEEAAYWQDKNKMAKSVLALYANKLVLFEQNENILPEVQSIPAFGHTPGHTLYKLTNNKKSVLVWGDITHAYTQFANPGVYLAFDTDSEMAVKTREQVMKMAAEEKLPIAGMHILAPGVGKLTKSGTGYKFTQGM